MKVEILPHSFPGWREAYLYAKASQRAILAHVEKTYAVICPLGSFIDVEHIEGISIMENQKCSV